MRNYTDFNFPAFRAAAAALRAAGHFVFSPAERDDERHGSNLCSGTSGDLAEIEAKGFNIRVALGEDLAFICDDAEAIALLPGWKDSKGATAEVAVAQALGLHFRPWEDFL